MDTPLTPSHPAVVSAIPSITGCTADEECINLGMPKVSGHGNVDATSKPIAHGPVVLISGIRTGASVGYMSSLSTAVYVHSVGPITLDTTSKPYFRTITVVPVSVRTSVAALVRSVVLKESCEKLVSSSSFKLLVKGLKTSPEYPLLSRNCSNPIYKAIVCNTP